MVDSTNKLRKSKQYNWLLKNDVPNHCILFHATRQHPTVLLAKNKSANSKIETSSYYSKDACNIME